LVTHQTTRVHFEKLSLDQIEYYVDTFKPFDKAGAYGIQDWIGLIGISKIEGSYSSVVGLPTSLLYNSLKIMTSKMP
jgi:septum formation protein